MRCSMLLTIVFCALAWSSSSARAWNYTGHRLIATLAYDELTPAARNKLDALLRAHPRYDADLLADLPQGYDPKPYAFAMAGYWPDIVRSPQNPMHFTSHQPQWHYINVPIEFTGGGAQPATQPATQATSATAPASQPAGEPQNVVEAIDKARIDIVNASVSDADRAVALCWLIHLVGDLHQPLHAATLFSPQFPAGDRGGNLFIVMKGYQQQNLHSIWDESLGTQSSPFVIGYVASGMMNDPQFKRDALQDVADLNPLTWMKESSAAARESAYLNGELKGISSDELRQDPAAPVPLLPRGYLRDAELVSLKRAALAGHRLAQLLNDAFSVSER